MDKFTFNDKVFVITGASAGIGKALALQLSQHKAKLALGARNQEKLQEAAKECKKNGAEVIAVSVDVAIEESCRNFIKKTVETFGKIDVLINNAGITMWAYFDQIKNMDILHHIMQVNYMGSVYCTHYALPYLKKSKGRIVGISSLTGKSGVPTRSGYAASKHAMAGFFDTLRIELKNSGVSVTMVYPGFVSTEVRQRALGPDGKPLGKSPVKEKKVMSPEKCASLILPAIAKRKRELVMTTRGKLGIWLKLIAPSLVDSIAEKAIEKGK
jgi:short-subunit dehydrogenase